MARTARQYRAVAEYRRQTKDGGQIRHPFGKLIGGIRQCSIIERYALVRAHHGTEGLARGAAAVVSLGYLMTSEADQEIVGVLDEEVTSPYAGDLQDESRYGKVPTGGADGRYEDIWEADVRVMMGMVGWKDMGEMASERN